MLKSMFYGIRKGCCSVMLFMLGMCVLPNAVQAQESTEIGKTLKYGVKLGAAVSTFTNQQPHNSFIAGLTGGGFLTYSFTENIGAQAEVLFAQEGGRLLYFDIPELIGKDYWYGVSAENQRLVMNTLNVPLLFKYSKPLGNTNLSLLVGPSFGYMINAKAHKEVTVFTESGSFHTYTGTEDVTSNLERYNLAAVAGFGIEIPVGEFILMFEGRYKYGLTPVFKSYSYVGIPQVAGDLNCHSVSLTLGLGF